MAILKWDDISRLGKSRILQSSYIWLFIVPIAAKSLSIVSNPLVLTGISEGLRIDISLPFSWKCFYLSSVFVSLGSLVYLLRCPEIIRRFGTFSEFQAEGRRVDYLKTYFREVRNSAKTENEGIDHWELGEELKDVANDGNLPTYFWRVHDLENNQYPASRFFCLASYTIGLVLIGVVLVQNFVFVIGQIF